MNHFVIEMKKAPGLILFMWCFMFSPQNMDNKVLLLLRTPKDPAQRLFTPFGFIVKFESHGVVQETKQNQNGGRST